MSEQRYLNLFKDIKSTKKLVVTRLGIEVHPSKFDFDYHPEPVGVMGEVIDMRTLDDGNLGVVIKALHRIKIVDYFRSYSDSNYAIGEIAPLFEERIEKRK